MFKVLYDRFKAKTPKFFKHVVIGCAIMGSTGGAIAAAGTTVPAKIQAVSGYLITAGIAGGVIAQLTKEDSKPEA
jgi:hypothetical protein